VGDLRIPQSAVLPDLSSTSPPLLEEPGAEHEGPVLPKFLVLKNSFGFGGTNVSLVFADLPADWLNFNPSKASRIVVKLLDSSARLERFKFSVIFLSMAVFLFVN
jgi:hypothetical protein